MILKMEVLLKVVYLPSASDLCSNVRMLDVPYCMLLGVLNMPDYTIKKMWFNINNVKKMWFKCNRLENA